MLRTLTLSLLVFTCVLPSTFSASWYVDKYATGSNNGTSWTNAWREGSNVVWGASGVKAGDTLYMSGASTGKVYSSGIAFGASGTTAGGKITLRVGPEGTAHNGYVDLPSISVNTQTNIEINGAISDSFTPASSVWNLAEDNQNRGFQLSKTVGDALFVSGAGGQNLTIKWIEVGQVGTSSNIGDCHGIRFLNLSVLKQAIISRCWIHDIQNDGININSVMTNPDEFDALVVEWCLIERTGDDGIQSVRNGFTLRNSFLRDHWIGLYNGHPDQLQLSGVSSRYMRIYNNIFRNKANSLIIGEQYVTEGGTIGPLHIYGNIFYTTTDWYYRDIQAYGATFDAWRPNGDNGGSSPPYTVTSVISAKIDDLQILNNTVYGQRTTPFKIGRVTPADNTDGNGRGTRSVWQLYLTNSLIEGNAFLDNKYNTPDTPSVLVVSGSGAPGTGTNGVYYNAADIPLSNNIVAGVNRYISYGGVSGFANTFGNNNVTNRPIMDVSNYTFALDATDTVARNKALNLSALTSKFPGINTDLTGTLRGADGAWDIGALEYRNPVISSGLVMRLDFSLPFTGGIVDDMSRTGLADGLRFGKILTPTNWPTATTFTNPFNNAILPAANFEWYYDDGYGDYSKSGDYVAVTNVAAFKSLSKMSVMLWHLFDQLYTNIPSNLTWTPDNNATLIGADMGETGNWMIGRHGTDFPQIIVFTANNASSDIAVGSWLDRTFSAPYGYSRTWKHIGFTFDSGTFITYSNAVAISTNSSSGLTSLVVRRWLSLGCLTHGNHDPQLVNGDSFDQWPNNGWLNGKIADARIYNRVVSPSEWIQIVNGTEIDYGDGGSSGGSGGSGGGSGGGTNGAALGSTVLRSGTATVQGNATVGSIILTP